MACMRFISGAKSPRRLGLSTRELTGQRKIEVMIFFCTCRLHHPPGSMGIGAQGQGQGPIFDNHPVGRLSCTLPFSCNGG
eukprot:11124797-Karenia_brevis.AAC.1